MPTKVLVLYNQPTLPADSPIAYSEHEILYTAEAVARHLTAAGYQVVSLGGGPDPESLLRGLREHRPDVVFNLFEGLAEHGQTEAYAAGILQWLGVPFTGSPFDTLTLARNKHLTKHLLRGAGLPTADFFVADALPLPECRLNWPVIVKPATQDASVGLDQGSVVTDQQALERRVQFLLDRFGPPVLVEELILGRELTLGVIESPELRPTAFAEVAYIEKEGFWPIITYDAKWNADSPDYQVTPAVYPAKVERRLADRLWRLAREAFRLTGCRDYARVDFRVNARNRPYILEVNPNPAYNPEGGLAGALAAVGITHAEFTVQMVKNALARGGNPANITWTSHKDDSAPATPAPREPRRRKVAR
jgi:D-alanine-D-alanine ligase